MVFFKKKVEEEVKKTEKGIREIKQAVEREKPVEDIKPIEMPKPTEEPKKPAFAPLFVKIDRYKSVLNMLNDLKATVILVKNAINVQENIEKVREDNRKLIESAINKIENKIVTLDSEFMRPKGFEDKMPPMLYESGSLEGVVEDLKVQIEDLKSELK